MYVFLRQSTCPRVVQMEETVEGEIVLQADENVSDLEPIILNNGRQKWRTWARQ